MAELAARDDLTGMPNRRSILATARQVNSEQRGSQQPACIAVLDIDHFKAVNDTYGHDVGDAALITFARVCSNSLRSQDRLGRFGGEESENRPGQRWFASLHSWLTQQIGSTPRIAKN